MEQRKVFRCIEPCLLLSDAVLHSVSWCISLSDISSDLLIETVVVHINTSALCRLDPLPITSGGAYQSRCTLCNAG